MSSSNTFTENKFGFKNLNYKKTVKVSVLTLNMSDLELVDLLRELVFLNGLGSWD